MSRHGKPPALPPDETSEQLRARLRRFAIATRDEASRTAMIRFREHVNWSPCHCGRAAARATTA
jgi:hypothetical protein